MSKKILSEEESKKLFLECLNYPLFVLELSEYEKQRILDHAFEEYNQLRAKAIQFLSNPSDISILSESEQSRLFWNDISSEPANFINKTNEFKKFEDIPAEDQLNYFFTFISDVAIRLHVLFKNLGFDMSLESWHLFPTPDEPQQSIKEDTSNKKPELSRCEVAFLLFFKNELVRNPDYDENNTLKNFVSSYGHKNKTSARQIYYDFYLKIIQATEEQQTLKNIIESFSLKTEKRSYKQIKKDIEKILYLLTEDEKKKADEYLRVLNLLIN